MSRSKFLTLCVIILFAAVVLTAFSTRRVTAHRQNQISEQLARQIDSLNQEKESRTPTQQKIDSHLLYAMKQSRGEAITSEVRSLQVNVNSDVNGFVLVDIKAKVSDNLLKDIVAQGGEVVFESASFNSITARLPLSSLETIAGSPDVQFIYQGDRARTHRASTPPSAAQRLPGVASGLFKNKDAFLQPARRPGFVERAERVRSNLKTALVSSAHPNLSTGPVTSEGDTTHKAAAARTTFNVDGTGVKIGVISDAVDSLASQQAAGELPAVTVLPGQAGFGGDEGTAMLEIIHDLAPGAQLYFATGFTSKASFAQNILDLRAAGCDIIVDDVQYFAEGVFQDDDVARSVNTVTADGAMYFSAAGDRGNEDDSTSSVWEGDFADSGTATVGSITLSGGTLHDFGGGVLGNQITGGGGVIVALFWSDPLGGSANDYDLYIVNSTGTAIVDASTDIQNGSQDPFEAVFFPGGSRVLIFRKTGAAPRAVHVNIFGARLAINTAGQTYGHSAAADAFSVAATPAAAFAAPPNPAGPYPGPFTSANVGEPSSSDGPRRIFYDPQGNPITPNNLLFATDGGDRAPKTGHHCSGWNLDGGDRIQSLLWHVGGRPSCRCDRSSTEIRQPVSY